MSSSSVASPKPRAAKKIFRDILAELRAISFHEAMALQRDAITLRREMKLLYSDRMFRTPLLRRAIEVLESYCDELEVDQQEMNLDEMGAVDAEIDRINDLIIDAEELMGKN